MNKKIIVYTFRTFPNIEKLENNFGDVFIFGKLKDDLEKFFELIENQKPDYILGLAISKTFSKVEKITINKFERIGKVSKENDKLKNKLFVPKYTKKLFKIGDKPTTTFCNWSMWKVSEFILEKKLKTKFTFIHITLEDLDKLKYIY